MAFNVGDSRARSKVAAIAALPAALCVIKGVLGSFIGDPRQRGTASPGPSMGGTGVPAVYTAVRWSLVLAAISAALGIAWWVTRRIKPTAVRVEEFLDD
jgi:hypothetical protein